MGLLSSLFGALSNRKETMDRAYQEYQRRPDDAIMYEFEREYRKRYSSLDALDPRFMALTKVAKERGLIEVRDGKVIKLRNF